MEAGPTIVLGLGSALPGDRAVGTAAVARLRDEWQFSPPVELIDFASFQTSLGELMASSGKMLIVCAIDRGLEPGTITEVTDGHICLMSIQPGDGEAWESSPRAAARLDLFVFKLMRRLENWGHAAWRSAPMAVHAHA